jgi:FG-GAP-like repeat/Abnormal spindle-like microcephaly-assoc'd, ASPM-SPD-2-Hydin/Protein of unknown function (DUF1573)
MRRHAPAIYFLLGALVFAPALAIAQNPVPFINQPLVPSAVAPGGPDFTLTVNGTGFVNGATINWNGSPLATTFVSNSQLTATVPAARIAIMGTASISVVNPAPGGGASNVAFIQISGQPSNSVRLGGGTGYAIDTSMTTYWMVAADFNGDGLPDLAVNMASRSTTAPRTGAVGIFLSAGNGTFKTSVAEYAVEPSYAMVAGDFNGDGKLDLALADGASGQVSVLLGNGDGTFQTPLNSPAGVGPTALVAGDFNGDGKLDLAVANSLGSDQAGAVSILLGRGDGTFAAPVSYPVGISPGRIVAGDLNGDGKLDLIITDEAPDGTNPYYQLLVSVLLGNGDGTFQSQLDTPIGGNLRSYSFVTADFNGDGKLDVALTDNGLPANLIGGELQILLGVGDGTFQKPVAYYLGDYNAETVVAGDFNEDGKLDVAIDDGGFILIVPGNGDGTFQAYQSMGDGSSIGPLVAADFDGDGLLDFAAIASLAYDSYVYNAWVSLQVPAAGLRPLSPDFGDRTLGTTSAPVHFTFKNNSASAMSITGVTVSGTDSGDFSETNNCPMSPATLAAGTLCTSNVTFSPTALGTRSAVLSVTESVPGSLQNTTLSGTGINPTAVLSPTSLTFGNQNELTTSSAQPVTLTNSGVGPLSITSITPSTNFAQTNNCGTSVAQGASCTINVTFTPATGGTLSGSITITDNAANSPQTVSLTGTGVPPTVTLSSTSLDFGSQPVSTTSVAQIVTVTNNGPGPLLVTGVTIGGTNPFSFAQTNTCLGTTDFPGTCTISVTFTPKKGGLLSAVISVADDAVQSPQTISVSGTGVLPTVTQSATSLTFADQDVGTTSAAQAVTITNTGAGPLTVSSVAISGTNAGDFAQTNNCKPSVAASASCTVNVTFSPKANGSRTATLTVNGNASSGPQTVSLTGTGLAPLVGLSPSSLTFSGGTVGTPTAAMNVTLTDTGGKELTISSILASASFVQTNDCPMSPSTLASSAHCTISITFTAAAAGTTFGALIVSDNALTGSTQTVALTGIASVSFAQQVVHTTSAPQTVSVMNTGAGAVTVTSVSATGDFAVASNPCGTIAPGGSCAPTLTFTPTGGGTRTGSLVIADTSPGSPHNVPLSGTGQDFVIAPATGSTNSASVAPGGTANYSLTFSPQGGLAATVTLTCSGAPAKANCNVNPGSLALDGTTPANATVTVTTTASSMLAPLGEMRNAPRAPAPFGAPPALWVSLFALAGLIALARLGTGRLRVRGIATRIALLAALALAASCGGGGSNVVQQPGTPKGDYTLTVTARTTSGATTVTHTLTLNLKVN